MNSSLKRNLVTGFIWSFVGQFGYLFVALLSNIVLVRLLSPFEFGQIGIIMFFIIFAKVLTESGLSGALVRKNSVTQEDYSTVFIFNLIISFLLFLIFLFSAGYIAEFYDDPSLKLILMVSSSILIINAFQITQNAKLVRDLNFKKKSIYAFISILIASIVGVFMALNGAGVWSLVTMQILTSLILSILLWIFEEPIGKLVFSKSSFKGLYKFGVFTTLSSLLNTAFDNIYQLILGKYFSINQTGLFYQAKKLQEVPVGIITSTMHGVVFSSLAKLQDDPKIFSQMYGRIVTVFTAILGFICVFIFLYAENVIKILYGSDWIGAVFYMQILIIASFFYMQEMFNRVVFKVFDKTEKILYLEITKKIIQSITIVIGVIFLNIEILLYGFLVTSIVSYFINVYYSKKVLSSFSWEEIIITVKVVSAAGIVTIMSSFLVRFLSLHNYYTFLLLPILAFIYFLLLRIMKVANIISDTKTIFKLIKK